MTKRQREAMIKRLEKIKDRLEAEEQRIGYDTGIGSEALAPIIGARNELDYAIEWLEED